jgi:hypothetical protein
MGSSPANPTPCRHSRVVHRNEDSPPRTPKPLSNILNLIVAFRCAGCGRYAVQTQSGRLLHQKYTPRRACVIASSCLEASRRPAAPVLPPCEGDRIIPPGPARDRAINLVERWQKNVVRLGQPPLIRRNGHRPSRLRTDEAAISKLRPLEGTSGPSSCTQATRSAQVTDSTIGPRNRPLIP